MKQLFKKQTEFFLSLMCEKLKSSTKMQNAHIHLSKKSTSKWKQKLKNMKEKKIEKINVK